MFTPDLAALPRTLILTAALDPLADEASAFAQRMRAAGAACEHWIRHDCVHAYLSFGVLAQARRDRQELARWLGPVLALERSPRNA
jgi:acetyl esterase